MEIRLPNDLFVSIFSSYDALACFNTAEKLSQIQLNAFFRAICLILFLEYLIHYVKICRISAAPNL